MITMFYLSYLIISTVISIASGQIIQYTTDGRQFRHIENNMEVISTNKEVPINQATHHVSVQRQNRHVCDGSIISENYVITHNVCFTADKVRAGSNYANYGGSIHEVINAVSFTNSEFLSRDDIILLKVTPSFTFDGYRQPIILSQTEIRPNATVFVTWFSKEKNDEDFQYLTGKFMSIIDKEQCNRYHNFNPDVFICGGNSAHLDNVVCPTYVGSPVIDNDVLVGLSLNLISCYDMYKNDLYASVAYYYNVIFDILKKDEGNTF